MDEFTHEQLGQVIRKYHSEMIRFKGIISEQTQEIQRLKIDIEKGNPEDLELYKEEN